MFSTEKAFRDACMSEAKEGVCRSRGGESCAFDGALIVLQPLADCVHLVHGPISCCANSWEGRGSLSSKGQMHKRGFTTAMNELDIVYGAEQKLLKAIKQSIEEFNPSAVIVYSTCVSGLTGEDLEAVCRQAEKETNKRVIPVDAPGFVGPKNLGNRLAGEALLNYVIGTGNISLPERTDTVWINLIGEYNIAGDLYDVEPVLQEAGIKVLARITGNGTFEEITYAHKAQLNVVVCGRALINVAKAMQRQYGIPYIEVSFFGMTEMARAMRQIAETAKRHLGDIDITEKVETVISKYEALTLQALRPFENLRGKRAILYGGGVKSWSYINALRDLGIEPVAVAVKKSTYEDEKKVRELLGEDTRVFEDTSAKNIKRIYKEYKADMFIAGSRNLYIAVKEGWPYVDINQERHIAYAGYRGLVNLAEQIEVGLRFYSNTKRPYSSPVIVKREDSALEIDPLRHSQSLGAIIAMQGIDKAIAILHGAQGCSFLSKVLIVKHFREPIALNASRIFTEDVVMGSEDKLQAVISETIQKQSPEVIGIISTALTEVKGDHISNVIKNLKPQATSKGCSVFYVSTPDYEGGLQDGYLKALKALLIDNIAKIPISQKDKIVGQINLIAGCHLTPADFVELREIVESFGLRPILIPDLGCLDGSRKGFSALTEGGTPVEDLKKASRSELSIVVGTSLGSAKDSPARLLQDLYGIDYISFDGLQSLDEIDSLFKTLSIISNKPIPERYLRQRQRLIDCMRDAQFYLSDKRVILALETDMAIQISKLTEEMAMKNVMAIVPSIDDSVYRIRTEAVIQGTLNDICERADLLISNSHAVLRAKALEMPLYQIGFPAYKNFGITLKETIGYRGAINCINDFVNLIHGGH